MTDRTLIDNISAAAAEVFGQDADKIVQFKQRLEALNIPGSSEPNITESEHLLVSVDAAIGLFDGFVGVSVTERDIKNLREELSNNASVGVGKCLVVVENGMAEAFTTPGVETFVFDKDGLSVGNDVDLIPEEFALLAHMADEEDFIDTSKLFNEKNSENIIVGNPLKA